ncbi:MAG: hypothetical protein ACPL7O_08435, partial [Armatimonadota bacterium]
MKKLAFRLYFVACLIFLTGLVIVFEGCGGRGPSRVSVVSGTVSDINRNMIVGARVWVGDKST